MTQPLICWTSTFVAPHTQVTMIGREIDGDTEVRRMLTDAEQRRIAAIVAEVLDDERDAWKDKGVPVDLVRLEFSGQYYCEGRARTMMAGTLVCGTCAERALWRFANSAALPWPIGDRT